MGSTLLIWNGLGVRVGWQHPLRIAFNWTKKAALSQGQLLEKVRIHRNDLMHFNEEDEIDYASELKSL